MLTNAELRSIKTSLEDASPTSKKRFNNMVREQYSMRAAAKAAGAEAATAEAAAAEAVGALKGGKKNYGQVIIKPNMKPYGDKGPVQTTVQALADNVFNLDIEGYNRYFVHEYKREKYPKHGGAWRMIPFAEKLKYPLEVKTIKSFEGDPPRLCTIVVSKPLVFGYASTLQLYEKDNSSPEGTAHFVPSTDPYDKNPRIPPGFKAADLVRVVVSKENTNDFIPKEYIVLSTHHRRILNEKDYDEDIKEWNAAGELVSGFEEARQARIQTQKRQRERFEEAREKFEKTRIQKQERLAKLRESKYNVREGKQSSPRKERKSPTPRQYSK